MNVLDASALLAYLRDEPGADRVKAALLAGSSCGAANWSEVAQKVRSTGRPWPIAAALLTSYDLRLEPVTVQDSERAAETWTRGSELSLADRLCLALGDRLDADILTADRAWGEAGRVRQIR